MKTFTVATPTKLDAVVADYVIDLIRKNMGGVQDSYRKLIAKTEEEAGQDSSTRRFEGIEWLVSEDRAQIMGGDFVHALDAIHLAR